MELRIPGVTIAWDTGGQGWRLFMQSFNFCAARHGACVGAHPWCGHWVASSPQSSPHSLPLRPCPVPPGKAVPPTKDNEIGYVALFGYRGNQVSAAQPRLLVSVPLVCRALRPPAGLGSLMSTAPLAADAQLR